LEGRCNLVARHAVGQVNSNGLVVVKGERRICRVQQQRGAVGAAELSHRLRCPQGVR